LRIFTNVWGKKSQNDIKRMIEEYTPNEEAMAKGRENLTQAKSVAELIGNEF